MDVFLTNLETKLKSPYSSLDLTKTISTNPNPEQFLQQLSQALGRLTKPIQLRCLLALLGLDLDEIQQQFDLEEKKDGNGGGGEEDGNDDDEGKRKVDRMVQLTQAVEQVLTKAETDEKEENKWVRIMAGIIRGKLFISSNNNKNGGESNEKESTTTTTTKQSLRSKETDEEIRKAVDSILSEVQNAAVDAYTCRSDAEVALAPPSDSESDDEKDELTLVDSLQLESDVSPFFCPWSYGLVSPQILDHAIPEVSELKDCNFNVDADCLHVDEKWERKKADEEMRLLEKRERIANDRQLKNSGAVAGIGSKKPINANSNGSLSKSKLSTTSSGTTSNSLKSKSVTGLRANGLGRGKAAMQKVGKLGGLGRGKAGNAVGGRSLANPMANRGQKSKLGINRSTFMNSRRKAGGALSSNASNAAKGIQSSKMASNINKSSNNSTGSKSSSKTKMKMIDVAEVEGLNKEHEVRKKELSAKEVEENKAAKKRKIYEKFAASKRGKDNNGAAKNSNANNGTLSNNNKASSTTTSHEENKNIIGPIKGNSTSNDFMEINDMYAPTSSLQHQSQRIALGISNNSASTVEQSQYSPEPATITNTMSTADKIKLAMARQYGDAVSPSEMSSTNSNSFLFSSQQQSQQTQDQQQQYPPQQQLPSTLPKTLPVEKNLSSFNSHLSQTQGQQYLSQQPQQQQVHQEHQYQTSQQQYPHQQQSLQQQQQQYPTEQVVQQQYPPQHQSQQLPQYLPQTTQQYPTQQQSQQQQQQQPQQQQQQQYPPQQQQNPNWRQLLEKSNKLAPEDRSRIEHFFTTKMNPTPQLPVYKMKLNEDKTVDPATGQAIKETLYLELDYGTFGYKMLRKVKKK